MADILAEDGQALLAEDGQTLLTEDGATGPVRLVFRARNAAKLNESGQQAGGSYTFDTLIRDAGDTTPIRLEFGEADGVAMRWERDQQVEVGEYVVPREPNGFAAQVTAAGTTGATEPAWPGTLDAPVPDGSAAWKMVPKALNGAATLATPTHEVDPTSSSLAAAGLAVLEGTSLVFDYTGGAYGDDIEVKFTVSVGGKARVARQIVKVRKL